MNKELLDAADLKARARLEAERDELTDRIALEILLDEARAEITRLQSLQLLVSCLNDTATTAITPWGIRLLTRSVPQRCATGFKRKSFAWRPTRFAASIGSAWSVKCASSPSPSQET